MAGILGIACVAVIVIIALLMKLDRERKIAGNIQGWVIDHDRDDMRSMIYRNYQYRISGRPDVLERSRVIEHKSAVVHGNAKQGDLRQVAALMLATGVDKAALQYANKTFDLSRNSPEMQPHIREVIKQSPVMLRHLKSRTAPRGNPYPKKCRRCEYKSRCPEIQSR